MIHFQKNTPLSSDYAYIYGSGGAPPCYCGLTQPGRSRHAGSATVWECPHWFLNCSTCPAPSQHVAEDNVDDVVLNKPLAGHIIRVFVQYLNT